MKRKKILALALSVCLVSATGAFAGWEAPVLTGLAEDIVAVDALSPEELTENDVRESAAAVLDAVESADISGTTVLVTKQEVADALAPHAAQLKGMAPDTEGVQRLPVLQVVFSDDSVGEGQTAVTMHKLDSIFNGKKVSELAPVKILGSDAMQVFEQVTAIGAIGDKSYAIVKKPSGCCQSVLGSDDIIGDGAVTDEFYIAVGIARDGDFDLGAEGVQIIDPVLVSSGNPRYMQTAPNFEGIPETVVKVALTKSNIPTENVDMAEITELKYNAWLEILDEIVAGEGSPETLQKLPAFAFQSDIGATTLTGFTLDASEFEGLSVSDISAAVGNTMMMATPLELVVDGVEPATFDGKFAIAVASDEEGLLEILGADAVIDATKQYFVLLGIMDGGEFDAAPAAGVVAAPAFLYSVPEAADVLEGPIVPLISEADLPEDVEIGTAIAPATIADSGLNTDAAATVEELEGSTVLFLKNDVVTSILEEFEAVLDESFSKKAPVFKTTLSEAGKTGLVMFALPASFAGKQSDKIVPVKAVSTTAADALPFEFVDDVADLADGTFAILESDKATFVAEGTVLAEGSVHYLLLAIQDGGDYDMNATEAVVSDPFFVGMDIAPTPTPEPEDPTPLDLAEPLIPVASLAEGVEIALNPTLPATVADTGLTETAAGAVETLLGGTHVILKDTVATNLLAYRARSMSPNVKVKVPVFKANVSDTGRTGIVMFVLPTTFAGKKAMDVLPVKAVSETASQSLLYGFTSAVSGLTDGKYAIFGSDRRTPLAGDTTLAAGTTYYIAFAVKDGGAFDKNETAAVIADPCLIGLAEAIGGGSSGGCSAAGFSPAMILLALPLLAVFGRK